MRVVQRRGGKRREEKGRVGHGSLGEWKGWEERVG